MLILFIYRRRQIVHFEKISEMQLGYEKSTLNSRLEIQEQTFQHISREIHDNISLSLTLAKLNLNTINWTDQLNSTEKVASSVDLLSQSIEQLRDLSKSLDADLIKKNGLISALRDEIFRIKKTGNFEIEYQISGDPFYLDSGAELILFRVIQEAFNNVIKHAKATEIYLKLHYENATLHLEIGDNGVGFEIGTKNSEQSGLKNMKARIVTLGGSMSVISQRGQGTKLEFDIPISKNEK